MTFASEIAAPTFPRHFPLSELTVSQLASRDGMEEQFAPPDDILSNLLRLANQLEVVRALLNSVPLIVSSGYRCGKLNALTPGAAKNSAHLLGLAADFTAPGFGTPFQICQRIAATKALEFDQVIFEYGGTAGGGWCHFAIGPGIRRQCLSKFYGDPVYHLGILEKAPAIA